MSIDTSIKSFRKKMKTNLTSMYRTFLSVAAVLMLLFLTSKFWLPSDVKVTNTSLGTALNTSSSTTVKLRSWVYSTTNHYMEITFDVDNRDESQSIKFTPSARVDTARTETLNSETALSYNGTLVIQIKDVPTNWHYVSLWIRDNLDTTEADESMSGANFFGDVRALQIDNSLKPRTGLVYAVQSVVNQIQDVKSQVKNYDTQIQEENTEINQLKFDIQGLKDNQKYQTADEVKASNSTINSKQSQIDTHKDNVLKLKGQIADAQEKLKKLNQKLEDTKTGKLSAPVAPAVSSGASSAAASSEAVTVD